MSSHSLLSPSSAPRWMRCPGSVAASYGVPDESSEYADEGTAAHTLAAECLRTGEDTDQFLGVVISVYEDGTTTDFKTVPQKPIRRSFTVDDEMAEHVQLYVDAIRRKRADNKAELLVEQRVVFGDDIGVPEQGGTGDAILIYGRTIDVNDLKYGAGVRVDASWEDEQGKQQPNEQLGLYGLGAMRKAELTEEDFDTIKLGINQPRIGQDGHVSEHIMTRAELMAFAQSARAAAAEAMSGFLYAATDGMTPLPVAELDRLGMLRPGEKQCRFCPMANGETGPECPALRRGMVAAVFDPNDSPIVIDDVPTIALPRPELLELMETYIAGARKRIWRELHAGRKVAGWKLVKGKAGARKWIKDKLDAAEKALKKLLKKDAYTEPELISPTEAEKRLKKAKRLEEYGVLVEFVERTPAGETLAADTDPEPEIVKTDVVALLGDNSDLID